MKHVPQKAGLVSTAFCYIAESRHAELDSQLPALVSKALEPRARQRKPSRAALQASPVQETDLQDAFQRK